MMFVSGFYITGHVGCYAGGLPKLCHKCVTDLYRRLMLLQFFFPCSQIRKYTSGQSWSSQQTALHQDLSTASPTLSPGSPMLLPMRQWFFQEIGLGGASHRQYWGLELKEQVSVTLVQDTSVLTLAYFPYICKERNVSIINSSACVFVSPSVHACICTS